MRGARDHAIGPRDFDILHSENDGTPHTTNPCSCMPQFLRPNKSTQHRVAGNDTETPLTLLNLIVLSYRSVQSSAFAMFLRTAAR